MSDVAVLAGQPLQRTASDFVQTAILLLRSIRITRKLNDKITVRQVGPFKTSNATSAPHRPWSSSVPLDKTNTSSRQSERTASRAGNCGHAVRSRCSGWGRLRVYVHVVCLCVRVDVCVDGWVDARVQCNVGQHDAGAVPFAVDEEADHLLPAVELIQERTIVDELEA